MTQPPIHYMTNRVLKLNVGFLLTGGPAHSHDSELDIPTVRVADDLTLKYVRGPIRLSHTKEGILVRAKIETAIDDECYRCLSKIEHLISIEVEELYAHHQQREAEFRINEDGMLDLAPLLRAEALIGVSHRALCQEDCQGLCSGCGINLNHAECICDSDDIDPRLAKLKKLLDS
jgi:uncharacterized protein